MICRLGLDQGTTGTTALLLDENWNVAGQGYREHTQVYPCPGYVEHDPMEIWDCVLQATADAIRQAGVSPDQISCIGLANQGETCMIWGKNTGKPLNNAIVWQDKRTAEQIDNLDILYSEKIRRKTGLVPDAYFSATKIRWLLDNTDGARTMANEGKLLAGTLDTWLIWKLTAGAVFTTDYSTASRTMLFNLETGDWDDEILDILEIPRSILPEIRNSSECYGHTDKEAFFGARIPVSGNVVDQQAALFGQACLQPGMVKTTYGTGCFMLMNTGSSPAYSKNRLLSTVAWGLDRHLTYALDGGAYVAGAVIKWLRDNMQMIHSATESEMLAREAGDNGGVYFVPAFAGLSAPYWNQHAKGIITGLSCGTTRQQIVRAALESTAFQVKDILDVMNSDSGHCTRVLRVDGGMVQNSFLCQFQADILGIPVHVPVVFETTALGAAYMASFGIGEVKSLKQIEENWKLARCYEPKMGADERETLLSGWRKAINLLI